MHRRVGFFFLLLSLFWHALTVAGQMPLLGSVEDREHAVAHLQEAAHHHMDDDAIHYDDSPDSTIHLLADGAASNAVLWQAVALVHPSLVGYVPWVDVVAYLPDPPRDGLRRPPRTLL